MALQPPHPQGLWSVWQGLVPVLHLGPSQNLPFALAHDHTLGLS